MPIYRKAFKNVKKCILRIDIYPQVGYHDDGRNDQTKFKGDTTMKITMQDTYSDKAFSLDMVSDWAIFARAKDAMSDAALSEDDAVRMAVEEEDSDFHYAINQIKEWKFDNIDAVQIADDDSFEIEDDFYTDEHMVEISKALEEALADSREADEYNRAYESEVEYSWYNR